VNYATVGISYLGSRDVLSKLEEARVAKVIGSSLEARAVIHPGATNEDLIKQYWDDLRYIFIVSQVRLAKPGELEERRFWITLALNVQKAKSVNVAGITRPM